MAVTKTQQAALQKAQDGETLTDAQAAGLQEAGLLWWESFGTPFARLVPSAAGRLAMLGVAPEDADEVLHGDGVGDVQGAKG